MLRTPKSNYLWVSEEHYSDLGHFTVVSCNECYMDIDEEYRPLSECCKSPCTGAHTNNKTDYLSNNVHHIELVCEVCGEFEDTVCDDSSNCNVCWCVHAFTTEVNISYTHTQSGHLCDVYCDSCKATVWRDYYTVLSSCCIGLCPAAHIKTEVDYHLDNAHYVVCVCLIEDCDYAEESVLYTDNSGVYPGCFACMELCPHTDTVWTYGEHTSQGHLKTFTCYDCNNTVSETEYVKLYTCSSCSGITDCNTVHEHREKIISPTHTEQMHQVEEICGANGCGMIMSYGYTEGTNCCVSPCHDHDYQFSASGNKHESDGHYIRFECTSCGDYSFDRYYGQYLGCASCESTCDHLTEDDQANNKYCYACAFFDPIGNVSGKIGYPFQRVKRDTQNDPVADTDFTEYFESYYYTPRLMTSGYGIRILNGVEDEHYAIDIAKVYERPGGLNTTENYYVVSLCDGYVIYCAKSPSRGNYVIIRSNIIDPSTNQNIVFILMHMKYLPDKFAQPNANNYQAVPISKGEIIQLAGNTGQSFGAHLDITIIRDSVSADGPVYYVGSRCTETNTIDPSNLYKDILTEQYYTRLTQ